MEIERLQMTPVQLTSDRLISAERENKHPVKTFGEFLEDYLRETNRLSNESERMNALLAAGQVNDVSDVMVAAQKADISLQLTVQVRNKAVEAYQELMRMQV